MIYGSVCSGIEAVTSAWHPLGFEAKWFAETDPFCSRLLAARWPTVPNLGDFTKIGAGRGKKAKYRADAIDILVGGTPCQSFSQSGKRGGLEDARGDLALEFLRLASRTRARWILWENVSGLLSLNKGRDLGAFLGAVAECGYGWAYRILDAQFSGVPQRRRRIFVVGYLGDWRRAAAVLFERQSLRWDPAPRRKKRSDIAGPLGSGSAGSGWRDDLERSGAFIPVDDEPAHALTTREGGRQDPNGETYVTGPNLNSGVAHTLRAAGHDASEDGTGRGTPLCFHMRQDPIASEERSPSLGAMSGGMGVFAFDEVQITSPENRSKVRPGGVAPTMSKTSRMSIGQVGSNAVRRLTPLECERLMGFPDNWTALDGASDAQRYHAIGNSMAVPLVRWIGRKIEQVDGIESGADDERYAAPEESP